MKLYTRMVAENLVASMYATSEFNDAEHLKILASERTRLLSTAISVIVFLFTTITIIALTLFSSDLNQSDAFTSTSDGVAFLGLKITDPDLLAFSAFMVGNILYVVCTGLFMRLFIYEFTILTIIQDPRFSGERAFSAVVRSFHANIFPAIRIFGLDRGVGRITKAVMFFSDVYSKYYIIATYGFYYYAVLGYFVYTEMREGDYAFSVLLILFNTLSAFTSFAIFFVVSDRTQKNVKSLDER